MSIRFSCPECKKEFEVGDDLAGKRIRCKGCSTLMVVPGEPEVIAAEVVDDPGSPERGRVRDDDERSARPRRRERVDDSPSDDDRPRRRDQDRDRDRPRRKKSSALKIFLVLGVLGGLFAVMLCGGGFAAWYFAIRDRGLADDLKYMPDTFTSLHVINFDAVKNAPAYAKAQTCPGGKEHFAFTKTPDGKSVDVVRAMIGETSFDKVTVLTLRNEPTIQDLVDPSTKLTESTIAGKKVYETSKSSYLIVGKRVVIASNAAMQKILQRNGTAKFSDSTRDAMKEVDFSRPETVVIDFSQVLSGLRDLMQTIGQELPVAIVMDMDYQMPMNVNYKLVCRDEKAAETLQNGAGRGPNFWGSSKLQIMTTKRRGPMVTVEAKANDPCDALGPNAAPGAPPIIR
jgi:hypothetical protein